MGRYKPWDRESISSLHESESSDCEDSDQFLNGASSPALIEDHWVRRELFTLLGHVDKHAIGSFATSGTLPNAVNPGLTITDLDDVGLPLSKRDALEISKIAHQAPFGKGTETIVDTEVRNTWELNPSGFTLRNPEWQACIENVVSRVVNELGIVGETKAVSAELYKLLLYEKGAFFERHKDSEKVPGMFGTLIIALPSSHQGGDVQTSFGGQAQTLKTSESSDFGFSYLAWYADVEHAVLPVTSGYRLVLTYNLISHSGPQSASTLGDDHAKLCRILGSWTTSQENGDYGSPNMLAYLLAHEYTESSLRLDLLKGRDHHKGDYLRKACEACGFCMSLAQLEYTRNGGCDEDGYDYGSYHKLYEVYDTHLTLLKVFGTDGNQIAKDVDLRKSALVQRDAFKHTEPDDEDYSGYTGNEGVSATHFYRRTCIVIMPRNKKVDFLFESKLKGSTDLRTWVDGMLKEYEETPADPYIRSDLESFCALVVQRNRETDGRAPMGRHYYPWEQPQPVPDETLSCAASVALRLRQPQLFENIAAVAHEMLSSAVYVGLGKCIAQEGIERWAIALEKIMSCIKSLQKNHDAMMIVNKAMVTEAGNASKDPIAAQSVNLKMWGNFRTKLDSLENVDQGDTASLIELAAVLGTEALSGSIVPMVEKHIAKLDFVISFLQLLQDNNKIDRVTRDQALYTIHGQLAHSFSIHGAFPLEKPTVPGFSGRAPWDDHSTPTLPTTTKDKVYALVKFLAQSYSWGLVDNVRQIVDKVASESTHIKADYFASVLIPFLKFSSTTALKSHDSVHFNDLVRKVVTAYTQRYVGMEPARPQDWTRPIVGRGCKNCNFLGHWLNDPIRKQIRYDGIAQPPKAHLEKMLNRESQCRPERDKTVSPHGLVITKTQGRWEQDHRQWKSRCTEAVNLIKDTAPEPDLQEMLGDQHDPLLNLTAQKLPANAPRKEPPSVEMVKVVPKSPDPGSVKAKNVKNHIGEGKRATASLGRPPLAAKNAHNLPSPHPPASVAGIKRPHSAVDIIELE